METAEPVRRPSAPDAARFGLSFDRVVIPDRVGAEPDRRALVDLIDGSEADIVVARYPARHVDWFAALGSTGRDLLFADTLVYWRLGLDPIPESARTRADVAVAIEDGVDDAVVESLVEAGFRDYPSHYRANPLLDPDGARAGYVEWALNVARSGDAFGLRHHDHGVVGFAVQQPSGDHAEVLLAAVRPDVQGGGLYHHLFAACARRSAERGCSRLVSSTQAHNLAGQRAWARFGLEPVAAFTTVHAVRPGLLQAGR